MKGVSEVAFVVTKLSRCGVKPNPKSMGLGLERTTRTTNFASACCARSVVVNTNLAHFAKEFYKDLRGPKVSI